MELKKCDMNDLDKLALWNMESEVDSRHGCWWGEPQESPELLEDSRENMERYLTDDDHDVYKLIADGEPVGMLVVELARHYPGVHVEAFSIRREHRRKGYGTQALHALMELLGETAIDLEVYCWNERAIAFYRSFGFREIFWHMNYGT